MTRTATVFHDDNVSQIKNLCNVETQNGIVLFTVEDEEGVNETQLGVPLANLKYFWIANEEQA